MIDDDSDEHEIFKMAVDDLHQSLNTLFFYDCESAIEHFSQSTAVAPGYVFMDFRLPRIDGDSCLQELQRLKQFDEPLLVIFSSSLPGDWREKLLNVGADEFLEKTSSIELLSQRIANLIETS
ncbi:Response regulator receiver domain-containing protein [Dyadobacter soli]|uniref:Response regulator receiver domain-containing protein n=2 Tax=Dyadobacter soli TaxID=659014 RepID=A0A1G7MPZ0_9BACT|nr:Response regulator receiver domain-containing protein [Dyadobacter soli]